MSQARCGCGTRASAGGAGSCAQPLPNTHTHTHIHKHTHTHTHTSTQAQAHACVPQTHEMPLQGVHYGMFPGAGSPPTTVWTAIRPHNWRPATNEEFLVEFDMLTGVCVCGGGVGVGVGVCVHARVCGRFLAGYAPVLRGRGAVVKARRQPAPKLTPARAGARRRGAPRAHPLALHARRGALRRQGVRDRHRQRAAAGVRVPGDDAGAATFQGGRWASGRKYPAPSRLPDARMVCGKGFHWSQQHTPPAATHPHTHTHTRTHTHDPSPGPWSCSR